MSDQLHFTYILECSDGTLYTGYTTDPDRRMQEHNDGEAAKYTRGRTPVQMVFIAMHDSKSEALTEENRIKRLDREGKIKLIRTTAERDDRIQEVRRMIESYKNHHDGHIYDSNPLIDELKRLQERDEERDHFNLSGF